jgi:dTDP-4-dehydrorhamnose reductase
MLIVVTGANGMIGGEVIRSAVSRGHRVLAVGRGPNRLKAGDYGYTSVDLLDLDKLAATVKTFDPDAIVHAGAMTDVDECERCPVRAWSTNFEPTSVLANYCRTHEVRMLYVSTDSVFDGKSGPYTELDIPNPINVYSRTKLAGECVVSDVCSDFAIARIGVVYGGRKGGKSTFADRTVSALAEGRKAYAWGDQVCSTTLASAAGDRFVDILEDGWQGIIHASDRGSYSRITFAIAVAKEFGFDTSLISLASMVDSNLPAKRPALGGLRTDVCEKVFLKHPPLDLKEAVRRYHIEKDGV